MTPRDDERRKLREKQFDADRAWEYLRSKNVPNLVEFAGIVKDGRAEQAETPIDIPFSDAPCGHPGQYCWTEDGGKHIVCLLCEFKKAATVSTEPSAQAETPRAAEPDYKALVELAARVLLQHMNDEDYEMSLAGLYATLTEHKSTPAPTEPLQIHSGLKVRCHDCGGYQIWRCTEKDVIEVFHDCVAGRAKKAAAPVEDRPAAETPPEDLVVTIARELYDRFVMGGWEPQDAYGQIREWLRQAEWISVATRLPERLGAFLIWHRSGYVDTWHFNPIDKFNVNHWKRNATHWQELPACPVAPTLEMDQSKLSGAFWVNSPAPEKE